MLFSDEKDKMTKNIWKQGEGYILLNGQEIEMCKVDKIRDFEILNKRIAEKMK